MFRTLGFGSIPAGVLALLFTANSASAQVESAPGARTLINQNIDERNQVELKGNTRAEANAANDRGAVADDFPMEHMLLQLRRSPEQEQALQHFVDDLHRPGSPNFHRWITAQEFGARFGLAQQDLDTITRWLGSHGFQVNVVYPNGMVVDFSGTAGQVREAFKTEIHHLEVKGEKHLANMSDPRIPAALAPVVAGIVSLHDFRPHTMHTMREARPNFTFSGSYGPTYALVPADLATIYNLNPLFAAGYSGQGQTIVVIEDTDIFSAADWNTFRSTLGLSSYSSGSFSTVYPAPPSGANNCSRPGIIAPNDAEAILDAEWASAAAPSAAIEMASCADTVTTFGGLIALQNLINSSSQPPAIMSISYGQCETQNGASANAAYGSAYQQAVTEGVSVFVAAGDSGAAGCDNSVSEATHGVGVNAFASTPYNVAVGGTDFSDTSSNTNATYWSSTNTSAYGSALSYIPEIPWDDSCAGQLVSSYEGYATPYGSNGFCNSSLGSYLLTTVAGGGGPSGCATGTPSISGVVSGSCQGWPKPSWQSVLGNPADGVRDTPDVSLFAADGLWSHYYVFCWSDTRNGGAACSGAPSGWSGAGGTSFASPIMAGIQALVNQKAGGPQGNPNPAYYQLAATEYGSSGSSSCNSSSGAAVAANCIFYDVTQADMDVNCAGTANCYLPSGTVGVLSTSDSLYKPAFGATTGWDFATGIGSVNATNLVNNWPSSTPYYTLSTSPGSLIITQGAGGTSTITVTPQNGFSDNVTFAASGLPSGVTASFTPNPANTASTLTLTAGSTATPGTATVTITGTSGSLTQTTTLALTVNSVGSFTLAASPTSLTFTQGAGGTSTVTVTPQNGFNGSISFSASGLPSGVTASFSPNPATATSTLTLTASSTATTGTSTVTITGTSGSLTSTATIALSVNIAPNYTLSASPTSLTFTQGANGSSTITVTPQNGFSGNVSLSASGLPSGVTALFSPNPAMATSTSTLTASGTATTGTATVTITGTSGSLTHTTTITLTVLAPPLLTVWLDQDVGQVGVAGSASYANGTFTVKGAGQQVWGTADGLNFLYQPLSGDGTIVARLVSLHGGLSAQSAGVMIRETLTAGSTNAYTAFGGSSYIYFDERLSTGGGTTSADTPGPVTLPYWVKLVRSGNTFSGYASLDGVNWLPIGTSQTITMAQNVYIGLVVNSDNTSALATATFDNVSTSTPAAPAPAITNVSATTAAIGSQVVITGTGFGASQGSSAVYLNGALVTVNSWSTTSITITIPSGATSGPLAVAVAPTMNSSNPVTFTVTSQPLPPPWLDQDVGQVGVAGSATYANGTFTVKGAGQQIWGTADALHFAYQPLSGDGAIVARLVSLQGGLSVESTGVMIRETLTASSTNAYTAFGNGSRIYFDERLSAGGQSTSASTPGPVTLPYWVKLVRSGNTFSGYASLDGVNWSPIGTSQTITMVQNVYIGLAVNSDNTSALATATFDNVSTSSAAAPAPVITNLSPTSGAVGSQVVITGTGFGASQGSSVVYLNGALLTVDSWSPTSITVTIPSGATSGPLAVAVAPSMNTSNPVTFTVTAAPAPNYTLSASPGSLTFAQGANGASTITVTPQNGFNASVSLSASGLPSGVTASFSPNPATSTSSLTLTASGTATTGTSTVTITGTSGSLTNTTTITLTVTAAGAPPLLTVWLDQDVGQVGVAGSASYANGTFTVKGAGQQIWGTADGLNFVYQPLSGDGTIVARLVSLQGGLSAQSAGVMIRETLTAGSTNAYTAFGSNSHIYFDERLSTGGGTSSADTPSPVTLPYWVKLVRSGNTFSGYASLDGVNWLQIGTSQTITMAQNVYIGLVVNSDNTSALATATFDNVSTSTPAAPAPAITSVSATTGAIGSQVVITGTGFGASQGSSVVYLNDAPLTVNSWSAISLTVTIPSGATSGPLAVAVAPTMNSSNPITFTVTSQPLPASWLDQDVGQVGVAGSATYANGTFTVKGAGQQIWSTADGLHFAYQPLSGDGTIVARLVSLQGGLSVESTGVMIRETLTASSTNAYTAFGNGSRIYFDERLSAGGQSTSASTPGPVTLPYWVKLVRSGNTFSGYASLDGVNWSPIGTSQTITMVQNVYIGLAVNSDNTSALATATFDNVSTSSAAAPAPVITNLSPTSGAVGSQVVITGTGFGASQGGSVVYLNGAPVTVNSWSATSITTTIPSGATSGPLAVAVAPSMDSSNPVTFTVHQ